MHHHYRPEDIIKYFIEGDYQGVADHLGSSPSTARRIVKRTLAPLGYHLGGLGNRANEYRQWAREELKKRFYEPT